MIHYQLQCRHGHGFDGWFRDSAAFEAQVARGLLECPECGNTEISRALMAPAVAKSKPPAVPAPAPTQAEAPFAPVTVTGKKLPDKVRAMLQHLRAEIERNCEYVGPDFAAEARRIHRGDS